MSRPFAIYREYLYWHLSVTASSVLSTRSKLALVQNTNNINPAIADLVIKNDMTTLRQLTITKPDIVTNSSTGWILGNMSETGIEAQQILITLTHTPVPLGIAGNAKQVILRTLG